MGSASTTQTVSLVVGEQATVMVTCPSGYMPVQYLATGGDGAFAIQDVMVTGRTMTLTIEAVGDTYDGTFSALCI